MPELVLIIPLVTSGLCLAISRWAGYLTALTQLVSLGCCLVLGWQVVTAGPLVAGWFVIDALSAFILITLSLVAATAALYSAGYMKSLYVNLERARGRSQRWYYFQFNLFIFALLLIPMLENLGLVWIALELTTLASVFLVGYYNNANTLEAAWKYLIISSVGAVLGLWGTAILFYAAVHGQTPYEGLDWHALQPLAAGFSPQLMKFVLILTLIGYGTKAGLAPMHTWLPDAHGEAPTPVSALLSGAKTTVSFYVVMRFYFLAVVALGATAQHVMLAFSVLSIIIAGAFILQQRDYKRLLAYSTVEHIGIAGLGIGFGTPLAVYGALLHLFNHAMTKSMLFYTAGNINLKYNTKEIPKVSGLLSAMPFTGAVFLVGILAVTGLPPFSIFVSKLTILMAGFNSFPTVASFLLLMIAIIFFGFLRVASPMLFGQLAAEQRGTRRISRWSTSAVVLSLLVIAGAGVFTPYPLQQLLTSAAAVFLGR